METHKTLTWLQSSYLGTKISSYLERRRQFKYDLARLQVSLQFRPRNWGCHWPYDLTNETEDMHVWVANQDYGFKFRIKNRNYGGISPFYSFPLRSAFPSWRKRLLKVALEAMDNPWVHKYGLRWNHKDDPEWIKQHKGLCL